MSKKRKRKEAAAQATETAELEKQLDALTPEQAEMFVRAVELAMKKRRVMLLGYLSAIAAVVVGTVWALYMYGNTEEGTFIGWVFLVPFLGAAVLITGFGRISRALKPSKPTAPRDSKSSKPND